MTGPAIRRAEAPDVPVLRAIAAEAYSRYVPRMGRTPPPVDADYEAAVASGDTYVANVAVLPSAQGLGIGTRLLDFADARARELGLPEVRLFTHESMTENQAYYARRGYVLTHRAEEGGFRRLFYVKQLS